MRSSPIGAPSWRVLALLVSALSLGSLQATAEATPLEGEVVETASRWGYQGSAIITESLIQRRDGTRTRVHQLGGSVGGIGMRVSHSPVLLHAGQWVVLDTAAARTLTGGTMHQVRAVHSARLLGSMLGEHNKEPAQQDFVRTANASGAQIHWRSGCAFLSVSAEGSTQISAEREFTVIDEVLAHWTQETRACSNFQFINEGLDEREVGLDGINLIKFREDFWCRPASGDDPQECYDQAAAGLTTLFFIDDADSSRNGEIIDADMEFNGVQFAFAADGATNGSQACEADFANTLTHELGHFIGLDHTCWTGGSRLLDNEGNTVPACSGAGLSPAITDATMYNFQSCGETLKSTLTADDVAGFCGIYPSATTTSSCKRADIEPAGCCSIVGPASPKRTPWPGALLLLALSTIALTASRRKNH